MTDASAAHLINWTERMFRPILQEYQKSGLAAESEITFVRLFWIFDIIYAEQFDQNTFLADDEWLNQLSVDPKFFPKTDRRLRDQCSDHIQMMDFFLLRMARLVRLNARYVTMLSVFSSKQRF